MKGCYSGCEKRVCIDKACKPNLTASRYVLLGIKYFDLHLKNYVSCVQIDEFCVAMTSR